MSTALGIASVTHVLKDLLNDGLINNNVAKAVGTTIKVSSLSPGLVETESGANNTQLNLFMYRASHNAGWSNTAYPSRNERGEVISNPPLALDLHYLLTAFGDKELHTEILLGYGMQLFHENPVLARAAIRKSLKKAEPDGNGGTLPDELRQLTDSELAEQIEQMKISPEPINTEEISKLWAAFQSKYRPSAAYLVSVVLIESKRPTLSPLPVKERRFYAIPFKQQPTIEKILSRADDKAPIVENQKILIVHHLIIQGKQLKHEGLSILINDVPFTPFYDEALNKDQAAIILKNPLRSGMQGVQAVYPVFIGDPPEQRRGTESNLLAFVLSPKIADAEGDFQEIKKDGKDSDFFSGDITVHVTPPIYPRQKVILLLNATTPVAEKEPSSYSFLLAANELGGNEDQDPVESVTFKIGRIRKGKYLIRIRVDGAESPFWSDENGESKVFNIGINEPSE